MVPITGARTFEDLSITDPIRRKAMFGQCDHVRRYGRDFEQRLTECGFKVRPFHLYAIANRIEEKQYALSIRDIVYLCIK